MPPRTVQLETNCACSYLLEFPSIKSIPKILKDASYVLFRHCWKESLYSQGELVCQLIILRTSSSFDKMFDRMYCTTLFQFQILIHCLVFIIRKQIQPTRLLRVLTLLDSLLTISLANNVLHVRRDLECICLILPRNRCKLMSHLSEKACILSIRVKGKGKEMGNIILRRK